MVALNLLKIYHTLRQFVLNYELYKFLLSKYFSSKFNRMANKLDIVWFGRKTHDELYSLLVTYCDDYLFFT